MSRHGRWTRILTLHCETASELASQEMDEPLGFADHLALRAHILICRSCRRFQRQLLWMRLAARSRSRVGVLDQATLSPEARVRIAEALREGGNDDGPPP
ncbi:zf-HC2 domain-containing protein [Paludisphaera borealis]|uniref:Putative zinc-finger domain-containing protein n=1 Tax=Paludisphaera borealis TaxID=1387353 RepID=A0A1U7CU71_9BACT|nr:zf-HC2 domain-containing protein [Paludisphaera borealis]APW62500.1 hypothetical protein BSF38_04046 [Paludisphaera borealis]